MKHLNPFLILLSSVSQIGRCVLCFLCLITLFSCNSEPTQNQENTYHIIPKPAQITPGQGAFTVNADVEIVVIEDNGLMGVAAQLQEKIQEKGISVPIVDAAGKKNSIVFELDNSIEHDEGYALTVTGSEIVVKSKTPAGAFYAVQSLRQLSPVNIESENGIGKNEWKIPAVQITDSPRFQYRGMHLDVARHFFTVEEVKEFIDQLAYHKMNRFHWHLTEDQGWRIEIKKYPKLTGISAFRKETLIGHANDRPKKFDGKRYGGFYTQEEIKDVVEYAQDRFVTIIPEIEMPGHSQAVLAAYPEFGCTDGPFEVVTEWGVFEEVYCPKEVTFKFLEDVLTEVMELFPSEYIHIGGDECPKTRWKESTFCQNLIKKEGLKDEHGLQSYFIKRIEKFLNANGRNIIGWDEILEGGLAPNATVMSWRGISGGIEAAKQGHDVIMTPTSHTYFDYYQADHPDEPLTIGGLIPLKKVYNYEPIPGELSEDEAQHVLGAQGNLWSEYMPTRKMLHYQAFPRLSALAEVNWLPKEQKNYDDFIERLSTHFQRLEVMGIQPANHTFDVKMKINSGEGAGVKVRLSKETKQGQILYSLDGSSLDGGSDVYSGELEIKDSQTLLAQTFDGDKSLGRGIEQNFNWHKAAGKTISFREQPADKYNVGGVGAVINAVRGNTERYGDAEWLGFEGKDPIATIDFGQSQNFKKVSLFFFKGEAQWIFLPKAVTIYVSEDGENFTKVGETGPVEGDTKVVTVPIDLNEANGKYMKVHVERYGIIPNGKQGAGHEAWLFMDEIIVE